jgi:Na+-transporting NADH:ubiquinone oxidoreductase subunit NqrC
VVTAKVVEVVGAGTLVVVVVVGVVASVVVSDVAAGLSELLHAAASGTSAKATNT